MCICLNEYPEQDMYFDSEIRKLIFKYALFAGDQSTRWGRERWLFCLVSSCLWLWLIIWAARKSVFAVSDQVGFKSACSATATSLNIATSHTATLTTILLRKGITKTNALIRMRRYPGLSARLLFACNKFRFSRIEAQVLSIYFVFFFLYVNIFDMCFWIFRLLLVFPYYLIKTLGPSKECIWNCRLL